MTKPTVAITIGQAHYKRMFSQQAWDALAQFATVIHHEGEEPTNKEELIALIPEADAVITSWGVAQLDADVMAAAPRLRAMVHMGSSVKRFVSDAFWERDTHLTSAGVTLARDVAETTLGLMIVGQKRIWPLGQHVRDGGWRDAPAWDKWFSRELFCKEVGIIGASNVGRYVIDLLKPFDTTILLYDPFVSAEEAAALGAIKLELDDLLRRADVVSLHAPANKHTYQMLNAEGLALMKDDALRLGADAVAVSAFPGAPDEAESLGRLAEVIGKVHAWGIPVMGEMVPGGFDSPAEMRTAESVSIAARVGAELGSDWMKIPYADGFEQVTAGCYVPAVILGGAKKGSEQSKWVRLMDCWGA